MDLHVDLGQVPAGDWLVRSALPVYLEVAGRHEDADWFRGLEPIEQATSSTYRPWRGAVSRALSILFEIEAGYPTIDDGMRVTPTFLVPRMEWLARYDRLNELCWFGGEGLLPSRVGGVASRIISEVIIQAAIRHWIETGSENGSQELCVAWDRAYRLTAEHGDLYDAD